MSSELKPCPFCGGMDPRVVKWHDEDGDHEYEVVCRNCGGSGNRSSDQSVTIATWNARVSPWISVKDRLPEEEGESEEDKSPPDVLIWVDQFRQKVAYWFPEQDGWKQPGGPLIQKDRVSHWSYLPEPPR